MRHLSFKGFLISYIGSLSLSEGVNISRLAEEAVSSPRLRAPLFLYAAVTRKGELFLKAAERHGLSDFYSDVALFLDRPVELLLQEGKLPLEYQKVYSSFKARRDRLQTDTATKELMRKRIIALKEEKQITNYRFYTDLELNGGNLNAWLKHGDHRLVSLDTARRVLSYAENVQN